MNTPEIGARNMMTLAAVAAAIADGVVLHVRAERLPGRRTPRRDPMPASVFTLGPDARGGFLLVDYSTVKSGEEHRFETAEEATRAGRKLLGWDRMIAFRVALLVVYPAPGKTSSLAEEDARIVASGARMAFAFAGRRPLRAPLFGGCGVKVDP